jgi:hypothetical protein
LKDCREMITRSAPRRRKSEFLSSVWEKLGVEL